MRSIIFLTIIVILAFITKAHDHPLVGVVSYPVSSKETLDEKYTSYIQAESVKFIESSGVRAVALKYDQDWSEHKQLLSQLNGLFVQNSFDVSMNNDPTFIGTLKSAYNYTIEQNANGDLFPLWVSGISALQLAKLISGDKRITEKVDALDYSSGLSISETFDGNPNTYITHKIKHNFLRYAYEDNSVYFNQDSAITLDIFKGSKLEEDFEIVAQAKDRKGRDFVAMLKSKRYPIILSFTLFEAVYNFYPENNVPHSSESTKLAVQFSKVFTNICRLNDRMFPTVADEFANNIFNNPLTVVTEPEYQTFYF